MFVRFLTASAVAAPATIFLLLALGQRVPALTDGSLCHAAAPCLNVSNHGTGSGILAFAANSSAVVGRTQRALANDPGDGNGVAGLLGIDSSAVPPGHTHVYTSALFGHSRYGEGTLSISDAWNGIVGATFNEPSTSNNAAFGVIGLDLTTDNTGANTAVAGVSNAGYGGFFATANQSKTTNFASDAIAGVDFSSDGGLLNVGVAGSSNGIGVLAQGFAPAQSATSAQFPALLVQCMSGGPAIVAASGTAAADTIMSLDCNGNLRLKGQVIGGTSSFADGRATATVERTGEAQVTKGAAEVRFDSAFAAAIDGRFSYTVLVTPEGNSHGLYVAQKTDRGFSVRENAPGGSTMPFGYRVVAHGLPHSPNVSRASKIGVQRAEFGRRALAAGTYLHSGADVAPKK